MSCYLLRTCTGDLVYIVIYMFQCYSRPHLLPQSFCTNASFSFSSPHSCSLLFFSLPLLNILAEVTNDLHVANCSVFIFIDLFLVAFVGVDFFLLLKHFLPLLFMTSYSLVSRIHCWSFLWTSFAYLLFLHGPSCYPQGPDIPFFLLFILSHRELLLVI